ncbi:MAG TPA: hypothetical protein VEN81_00370 [Planctomycetota bacterium]|nr:hypothetical protein [Planctomycetota bacterium]
MRILLPALAAILLAGAAQDDLKAKFEARRATDPVEAFRMLLEKPGEASQLIARPALAKQLTADLAVGLKAFADGKAEGVEKPFTRAALLAEPYSPELSRTLMKMLFLLKQARKTVVACPVCKGAGAAPCTACQEGFTPGPCPGCDAKGTIACFLCDGSGTLAHHGYKGKFVLTIPTDTTITVAQGRGTLHGQVVTYQMATCAGGSFHLHTDNEITCPHKNDPKKPARPISFDGSKTCGDFWKEMKLFAFNGKAKMQVNNNKGQLTTISPAAARRFFAECEICSGGRVPCDRCAGKKTDPCPLCAGKGQAPLLCPKCEGSSMIPCAACKGYGDASWVARVLPPSSAPALIQALNEQAAALREWTEERARRGLRLSQLALRIADAKKDLDPTAKLTDDTVEIVCPKCKGNGKDCEECWNAGRREYTIGTSQFERYAVAQKFDRQFKELQKGPPPPPELPPLPEIEAGVVAKEPVRPNNPPPSLGGPSTSSMAIPKNVEEMIKQADELYESGRAHLEKSKTASDNATWQDEAVKALQDLKKAQILYTAAQEAIDAKGAPMPKSLLEKHHLNMQALVMARKQAP